MLEATAEANNLSAVANAKDLYSSSMEEICGGNKPFMSTARIEAEHDRVKGKAMELFGSRRKMGGDDFSTRYRDTLLKVHARISTSCIHQSSIIQSTIDILLMDEIKLSTHSFSLFFSGNWRSICSFPSTKWVQKYIQECPNTCYTLYNCSYFLCFIRSFWTLWNVLVRKYVQLNDGSYSVDIRDLGICSVMLTYANNVSTCIERSTMFTLKC